MASIAASQNRSTTIAVWVLRILLGLAFLFFSFMKQSGQPNMVAEFDVVGLGQWFRYFTGGLELIGGLAILVPRTSVMGALLLLVVDVGAFIAQVAILHMDWIHCVVIGLLLVVLIVLQRSSLRARLNHA